MSLIALVDRLEDRGLEIPDKDRAARYLRHVGYYRLSPYTIPFQIGSPDHQFRDGTTFNDVLDLYVFDRTLRLLVMDALERVEIAVRAALTDHMSTTYDNPHWYMDHEHFRSLRQHEGLLDLVRNNIESRMRAAAEPNDTPALRRNGREGSESRAFVHRSALEHYLTTYGSPELPPSWVMVETLTIGQLKNAYRNLALRSDRNTIARSVGLTAPVLESWLETYVRVRNICAHHGRLWNVGLGVYPMIPTTPTISWLKMRDALPKESTKRLYPVLVSFQTVLGTVSPHSSWASRLHQLVGSRPEMNLRGMGIPEGWADDPFWRQQLHYR